MFVYYYGHVNRPFPTVERDLLALLTGLDGWAAAAYREGEEMRARIGVGGEPPRLAKTVRLEVGPPIRGEGQTLIPLGWEAAGAPGLFPRMEADLVVAPLGSALTQVALRGSCRPPLGALGRALDRAVLHRSAEASVKGFVDRILRALQREEVTRAAR